MEAQFWHERWQTGQIGFDQEAANPLLVRHFSRLGLAAGERIFIPLCGKTRDLGWLLHQGCSVVGVELSETAVEQLFERLQLQPDIQQAGALKRYRAERIDVYVGDFFGLSAAVLGPVDAIYDRAALVALPQAMRQRYTAHLVAITRRAPQLLICFEYNQQLMDGPPFSISAAEIKQHYGQYYAPQRLESVAVENGLKGQVPATEQLWLLRRAPSQQGPGG